MPERALQLRLFQGLKGEAWRRINRQTVIFGESMGPLPPAHDRTYEQFGYLSIPRLHAVGWYALLFSVKEGKEKQLVVAGPSVAQEIEHGVPLAAVRERSRLATRNIGEKVIISTSGAIVPRTSLEDTSGPDCQVYAWLEENDDDIELHITGMGHNTWVAGEWAGGRLESFWQLPKQRDQANS